MGQRCIQSRNFDKAITCVLKLLSGLAGEASSRDPIGQDLQT